MMKLVMISVVLLAACSKDDTSSAAGEPAGSSAATTATGAAAPAAANPRDAVIAAWKQGGLAPSAFTAASSSVGSDCQTGKVSKIDVLVCSYASPEAAKAAQPAAYTWIGDTTGTAQVRGQVVIAIADRVKGDPHGKTINQLMKLAPK